MYKRKSRGPRTDRCEILKLTLTLIYNPGQNIWNKIEKYSKIGQDKKSLISTFACFLTATAKV